MEVDRVEEAVDAVVFDSTLSAVVGSLVLARTAFMLSSALSSLVVFVDSACSWTSLSGVLYLGAIG